MTVDGCDHVAVAKPCARGGSSCANRAYQGAARGGGLCGDAEVGEVLNDAAGPSPAPIPLGRAALRRAGNDLAIVSYGAYVHTARRVADLDRILAHLYAGEAWHQMPRRGSLAALRRYSLWQRLYRLSLKRGWTYRGRQALREFLSPADWDTVRLPDSLFWAYPLVRPVGWLMRRARR